MASAFFIRLENFKKSSSRTIDEIVYYRMAKQILQEGLKGYHTIPYGKELHEAGRPLPDYFFEPLFKHPPVFTFLITFFMFLFGDNFIAAGYVSLLISALTIAVIYYLGRLLFNDRVGLFSAIFLWVDPVSIISSQKVWMDSTIAFFTLLSITLFVWAVKSNKDFYFILSGVMAGLAANTKYTGILAIFIIGLYAFVYRRELFGKKVFLFSLILPFIMLIPWVGWNFQVYGKGFIDKFLMIHHDAARFVHDLFSVKFLTLLFLLLVSFLFVYKRIKINSKILRQTDASSEPKDYSGILICTMGLVIFTLLWKQVLHSFQIDFLPRTSWQQGLFANESSLFYFGQLMEYSLVYVLSFIGLFFISGKTLNEAVILRTASIVILAFFIVWRAYQSRYILSALPFLIILAAGVLSTMIQRVGELKETPKRLFGKLAIILLLAIIALKAAYVNVFLSFPNDMCYF